MKEAEELRRRQEVKNARQQQERRQAAAKRITAGMNATTSRRHMRIILNEKVSTLEFLQEALRDALHLLVQERPSQPCAFLGRTLFKMMGLPKPPTPPRQ